MEYYSNEHYNPKALELYLSKNLLLEYLKILDISCLEEAKRLIECDDLTKERMVIYRALELEIKNRYLSEKITRVKINFNIQSPKRYSKKTLLYFLYINRLTDYLTTLSDEELERCHDIACDDIFDDECKILDAVRTKQEYREQTKAEKPTTKK